MNSSDFNPQLSLEPQATRCTRVSLPGYDFSTLSVAESCPRRGGFNLVVAENGRALFALAEWIGAGGDSVSAGVKLPETLLGDAAGNLSVGAVATRLNRELAGGTSRGHFQKLFLGRIEPSGNGFEYTNAGQNSLLVCGSGEVVDPDAGGPPLGIFEGLWYEEGQITLARGDVLLLWTDAVARARGQRGVRFSVDQLVQMVRQHPHSSAWGILGRVRRTMGRFVPDCHPPGAMVLVVVKKAG